MRHHSLALPDQNQSHTSTLPDHTLSDFPKYCGIATTFHGICVYTRSALRMPSSNTACFMSWVASSKRAAVPDDLYCSDDSPEALSTNWGRLLKSLTILPHHLPKVYLHLWLYLVPRMSVCQSSPYWWVFIMQRGRVVRAPDLKSVGRRFKSCSDR